VSAVPLTQLFFSISLYLPSLLIFLYPLPSPLRHANPPFNRISRSPSDLSVLFPPSFFLPLAITMSLIMVGIWVGATFCSFARARTCQNGIVGVLCRIDIPGMVFIRAMGYAELYIIARVRRRIVLSFFPPSLAIPVFFEAWRVFIFSLIFSSPKRIEPRRYKEYPRCMKPPFT